MAEPTIFKVELLQNTAYDCIGDILDIKFQDLEGNIYYYDALSRWCYLSPTDKWKKLDWTPKTRKEKTTVNYGNLREDSGHWYLIPLDKLEEYDTIVFKMNKFDIYDDARWEHEDELDEKFSVYRLSGGVYDLKILIEGKG